MNDIMPVIIASVLGHIVDIHVHVHVVVIFRQSVIPTCNSVGKRSLPFFITIHRGHWKLYIYYNKLMANGLL